MKLSVLFLTLSAAISVSAASLSVDKVFSSNMVLQRDRPIAFWGKASPGTAVTVSFAGKKQKILAGSDGKWKVLFPAMKGELKNYRAEISGGKEKVILEDVAVGDVWFCSGQSNMELPVGEKYKKGATCFNAEKEVAESDHPFLRHVYQNLTASHNKYLPAAYQPYLPDGWEKSSPKHTAKFSAVAYFFGRELLKRERIPIGLIHCSWAGTNIEPWISRQGYEKAGLAEDLSKLRKYDFTPGEEKKFEDNLRADYNRKAGKWYDAFRKCCPEFPRTVSGSSPWRKLKVTRPPKWNVFSFRTSFQIPQRGKGEYILQMKEPGDGGQLFLNGTPIAEFGPEEPRKTLRLVLPDVLLRKQGKNELVLNTMIWYKDWYTAENFRNVLNTELKNGPEKITLNEWQMREQFTGKDRPLTGNPPTRFGIPYRNSRFYCNNFNGMVHPWTAVPIKGIVWYQGCNNAGQEHYKPLLRALADDWRSWWNMPELPFLIVQLAGYGPSVAKTWREQDPNQRNAFAVTREIQMSMAELPHTGVICTIDIGEADNIHPGNKQDVGYRLALEAERLAYGKKLQSRGPVFARCRQEGSRIRAFFRHAESGLKTSDGKAPGAFAVAGKDRKFVWADAEISGNTVIAWSSKVPQPLYVRYAYVGYRGDCNLQNSEGLPAYPFRSDKP